MVCGRCSPVGTRRAAAKPRAQYHSDVNSRPSQPFSCARAYETITADPKTAAKTPPLSQPLECGIVADFLALSSGEGRGLRRRPRRRRDRRGVHGRAHDRRIGSISAEPSRSISSSRLARMACASRTFRALKASPNERSAQKIGGALKPLHFFSAATGERIWDSSMTR